MEKSNRTEKRKDTRTANKDKRAEKTAQLSAGRQRAVEADKEEIQRYGAIRKVEQIMKKTIFEEMGGTYIRQGDYFIPCLTVPEEEESRFIGVWGQRHLRYLKEYRRNVYLELLMNGRLNSYLADIEEQAQERFERMIEQMKAENVWEWVGRMNNIQVCKGDGG